MEYSFSLKIKEPSYGCGSTVEGYSSMLKALGFISSLKNIIMIKIFKHSLWKTKILDMKFLPKFLHLLLCKVLVS